MDLHSFEFSSNLFEYHELNLRFIDYYRFTHIHYHLSLCCDILHISKENAIYSICIDYTEISFHQKLYFLYCNFMRFLFFFHSKH